MNIQYTIPLTENQNKNIVKQEEYLSYLFIKSTDAIKPDVEVHNKPTIGSNETIVIEEKPVTSEYFEEIHSIKS